MRAAHCILPLGLLAFGLPACAPKTKQVFEAGVLSERPSADGLTEQQIDLNGDGRTEVWNFLRDRANAPKVVLRKESDLNFDGRVDVRAWFDDAGVLEKQEWDGDFDGRVDWVDHYQGGVRVLSEWDTNNDGKFDEFRSYESGRVRRKERDTNADEQIDFWEYLDETGKVVKTGRDVDGDGVMDERDE
ncbi:MAG: hypothetical protein JNM72_09730 [Deltaproteobacteria bacterium]|jgi:hypothetical protein|nr:hypothetical protein [Deltaproteobacteria bacterium]